MIKKTARKAIFAAACLFFATPALADDSLYRDLGGMDGIKKFVDVEMAYHLENPRIMHQFDETNIDRLKEQLVIFFCQTAGGPCKYTNHDMKVVHQGMHLTNVDFNALVEDMQKAMDDQGIPFSVQNRLLARLAPYQRQVVTK